MNRTNFFATCGWVLLVLLSAGCAGTRDNDAANTTTVNGWPEIKDSTQRRELELASAIPDQWVSGIEQAPDGFLLSCMSGDFAWHGRTKVVLVSDIDATDVVKFLEADYEESEFTLTTRQNVLDQYELQLIARDGIENYIIAEWEPGTLRIASGSPCFVLPEGTYPGGTW